MGHRVIEARIIVAEEYSEEAENIAAILERHLLETSGSHLTSWGVEVLDEDEAVR